MSAADLTWDDLCQEAIQTFGHEAARVYPFVRLGGLSDAARPRVRTHLGPATVLSVGADGFVEVVTNKAISACDRSEKQKFSRSSKIHFSQIRPPIAPPPTWQARRVAT